jgi:hypothetical protein
MRKQVIAALVSMSMASLAAAAGDEQAYQGTAADAVTTAIGLATPGLAEANPLGLATVPIRAALIEHAKTLPREEGQPLMDAVSATGWGAAASNVLMLAGAATAAPVVGLAVGYAVWKKGETEREFWNMCAVHQQLEAGVKCEFRAWKADEVVRIAQEMQMQRVVAVAPVSLPSPKAF